MSRLTDYGEKELRFRRAHVCTIVSQHCFRAPIINRVSEIRFPSIEAPIVPLPHARFLSRAYLWKCCVNIQGKILFGAMYIAWSKLNICFPNIAGDI